MPVDDPELQPFRCEVRTDQDTVRLRPVGDLDLATVPVVKAQLTELSSAGFTHMVLDLRAVRFLDSSGVHLLWSWRADNVADGLLFSVIAGPPAVQRVLEIAGLTGYLNYQSTE